MNQPASGLRRPSTHCFAFLGCLLTTAAVHAGSVLYVDDDAAANGDGASWDTAYRFLADALATAGGGGVDEIRVAQGLYRPDRDEANPAGTGDRFATFGLASGTALRGGYAGLGEPDPDARDVELYPTTLSGDLLGDDGPDFENNADNAYHVLDAESTGPGTELDGFVVTGGNASVEQSNGGGLLVHDSTLLVAGCSFLGNHADEDGGAVLATGFASDLTLSQCTFEGNRAADGGAVLVGLGELTMDRCVLRANTATNAGGGAYIAAMVNPIIHMCTFEANAAADDGGGSLHRGAGTIRHSTFRGNVAGDRGGGLLFGSGDAAVLECVFEDNTAGRYGGGIAAGNVDPEIVDCTFTRNHALRGGGFGTDSGDATLTGCAFTENTATDVGGGLYAWDRAEVVVSACTFTGNAAGTDGGGVFNADDGNGSFTDCVFTGNTASRRGGGFANIQDSSASIVGCRFEANSAPEGGGLSNIDSDPVITDTHFETNHATKGGGMWNGYRASVELTRCVFVANVATAFGGGLESTDGSADVVACIFAGNTAGALGGGANVIDASGPSFVNCLFTGNASGNSGGGLRCQNTPDAVVTNCSFSGNEAVFGGAVSVAGPAAVDVANCVVWGNGNEPVDGDVHARYSNVEGGAAGFGNIDADPRFVDPDGADGVAGTEDDDLRLRAGSPCIDAGENAAVPVAITTDLDGLARFIDDPATEDTGSGDPPLVDLGAYEFAGACAADLDGSGAVDFADILAILTAWGPCSGCPEDLDGSGAVDFADILVVLVAWGPCE